MANNFHIHNYYYENPQFQMIANNAVKNAVENTYNQMKTYSHSNSYINVNKYLMMLTINGSNDIITIKSQVNNITIAGWNNKLNGLDQKCLIDHLTILGDNNEVNLNKNCYKAIINLMGLNNIIKFDGVININLNIKTDININNNVNNRNVIPYYHKITNVQYRNVIPNYNNITNNNTNNRNATNSINNINNVNNVTANTPVNPSQNRESNIQQKPLIASVLSNSTIKEYIEQDKDLAKFSKKKLKLYLEMDEYQYKHILKYDSRKETNCAICLRDFHGVDIIKAFYKCGHIFHKACLKNWLMRSNFCPLCKGEIPGDIEENEDEDEDEDEDEYDDGAEYVGVVAEV